MDRDLQVVPAEQNQPIEIDIRKILEQMGLDRERWPVEWLEQVEQAEHAMSR
jgi:hypothetical protein